MLWKFREALNFGYNALAHTDFGHILRGDAVVGEYGFL